MKKILFAVAIFSTLFSDAQILNNGFENWSMDTAYFDGFGGFFKKDTFEFMNPDGWTTTNQLSGADTFGNIFLVTQSANAHSGSSAMRIYTDTLKTVGTPLGLKQLTIPGIALNGEFPLNLTNSVLLGGTLSPAQIPDAGQPFTHRLANLRGYFDYTPVYNDSIHAMDSCMIWAVLRKGNELIASARFQSSDSTNGYDPFVVPFTYYSCNAPDTLVLLIASSVPNFASVLSGSTKLVRGSVLFVDDLDYDTLPSSYAYPPIARLDVDTTSKNTAKNILVKLNDDDCDGLVATTTITNITTPVSGGTATAGGLTHIVYTPANNFVGLDSFSYTLNDGANTSMPAVVRVLVLNTSGIDETNLIPVTVYPVPANNTLNVVFEHSGKATANVYDVFGNLVSTSSLNANNSAISLENFSSGMYLLQILNEKGAVAARTKFTVAK